MFKGVLGEKTFPDCTVHIWLMNYSLLLLYSTEAAVTKVFNDRSQAANRGHVSALCLLVVTDAFATVNYILLLFRLERRFVVWHRT